LSKEGEKMFAQLNHGIVISVIMTICFASILNAKDLEVVNNKKSDYVIIVDKDALKTPKFAAQELQKYIEKVTGAKLPITDLPKDDGKNIFVGFSMYTDKLGVSLKNVPAEGFIIKTVGDSIVIAGKDTPGNPLNMHWRTGPQPGTLFGVYEFIEEYLGVRWFMPTELGEYAPQKKKLIVPKADIQQSPDFVSRHLQVGTDKDTVLWARRNKIGHSQIVSHSHNWYYIIPCYPSPAGWASWQTKRYPYKDHPEYYALVDGKRIMTHNGSGRIHNGQICTSNKDVQRICAEVAAESLEKSPDLSMFSISANDGGGYCECKNCTSLDHGDMSDRMMSFYNGVARNLEELAPRKLLGAYCYGNYTQPPKSTKPHKNLHLWMVHNDNLFSFDEYGLKKWKELVSSWGQVSSNMYYYTAYNGCGFWGFPVPTRHRMANLIKFTKEQGYKGHLMGGLGPQGGFGGMDFYIAAKAMWNSSLNADDLINEYYDKVYGKEAGEKIREYHELLESSIKDFVANNNKKLFDMNELGVLKISKVEVFEALYPKVRENGRSILSDALAKAPEGKCKQRVQLESDNFVAVELTLDAVQAYDKVKDQSSLENAVAFKKAVDAREVFFKANENSMALSMESIRRSDTGCRLPVTEEMADDLLSTQGKRREFACLLTDKPPVVDGKLSDECWQNAEKIVDFRQKDYAEKVRFNSTAMITRDKDSIYLAVECDDLEANNLLESVSKRDGNVWDDNEIELFFDLKRDGKKVYQLIFNSAGVQADLKYLDGKSDLGWNGKWTVKTSKGKNKWFAEVEIPYAMFSKKPYAGDIWRINVCRVRKTAKGSNTEYSQVTPTFGNFMKPEKFANLILK
jgi:hypothetical protein